jgi:hypothetical protein
LEQPAGSQKKPIEGEFVLIAHNMPSRIVVAMLQ